MTYVDFSEEHIGLKGKYVFINKLKTHRDLGVITGHMNKYFNNPQTKRMTINISSESPMFGNLIVPLSSYINNLNSNGRTIRVVTDGEERDDFRISNPVPASTANLESSTRILDRIWTVENEFHLNNTVQFFRRFLGGRLGFGCDVLDILEIAIIESLENALIHSGEGKCYFMGQIHKSKNYFTLCVSDSGIGVRKSLLDGGLSYEREPDALAASIKKGITSKHNFNMGGNGLYCLSRLSKVNRGHFCLWSGTSSIVVDGKNMSDRHYEHLPHLKYMDACSHIDFQVPLSGNLTADYDEVIVDDSIIDDSNTDIDGFHTIKIIELEGGYCTRHAGDKALDLVKRFLEFPTVLGVALDFDGIHICSMSFLDSFLGYLHKMIGSNEFNERIKIINATMGIRKNIYRLTKNR